MVLERAEIFIREGVMNEFLEVLVNQAIPLTKDFSGLISWKALRGVEDANSIMILAEWDSIESHVASRPEPAHAEFRRLVVPYTTGAKPTVHFIEI
jgi:quinol monooxygenase YgiN